MLSSLYILAAVYIFYFTQYDVILPQPQSYQADVNTNKPGYYGEYTK